jgi:hypothetical protein
VFSLAFALQYGLGHNAVRRILLVVVTIGAFEIGGQLIFGVSLTEPFWQLIIGDSSPLGIIFGERWVLFDV